ncbi:hypothetical protein RGQ29_025276 [Quercus rubra]|uniref:Uncharacterized protein n=1 Tax=Quercus rubra TaxID=3512 RepID=A0AAN7EYH3_QUERU|nr:hypothetical protein RGQ29_025276 [Quercus rubra]
MSKMLSKLAPRKNTWIIFNLLSSSSQPSNLVHSFSYQHPLYYHWQAPFLNPQMEYLTGPKQFSMPKQSSSFCMSNKSNQFFFLLGLNLVMESFLQTKSQCLISFYGF